MFGLEYWNSYFSRRLNCSNFIREPIPRINAMLR